MDVISRNRWSVVLAGVIILMCLGVAYSWGVFLVPIDQDLGWGRAKISFAVSTLLLVFSMFVVVGGFCEKNYGPRITATLGGILVSLGWVAASFSTSPLWLYVFYGVVAGIGTGLSYIPSISSGIKWFPEKKGLITGIIVFGFGFGTAFLSPLATHLIEEYGWRTTMMMYGLAFGGIIITAAQFLKAPKIINNVTHNLKIEDKKKNYSPKQMIGTAAFKIMFLTYFLAMIAGMMTIGHLSAFSRDKDFTALQAAFALTVLSISNGLGRITFGYLSDKVGGKNILTSLFIIIGLSMLLLYHTNSLPIMYIFSAIIGLCFGGFLAVYPPLTADYFGSRDFAVNYGLMFIGYGSGCFVGPLLGGFVHDVTKNYLIAFNIAGTLALIGGVLVFILLKNPQPQKAQAKD